MQVRTEREPPRREQLDRGGVTLRDTQLALLITTKKHREGKTMNIRSQFLVFASCFALTIVLCYASSEDPPPPAPPPEPVWSAPLVKSPLLLVEVPLGLLPQLELFDPAFGMDGERIEWIAEQHAGDLMMTFAGQQPDAWPDVPRTNQ